LFSVICVLVALLFLTGLIYYLPQSVLAAMIMVPVFGLLDFSAFRRLFSVSRDDGMIAVITFVVTLFSMPRLHWGVFAGIGLTMVSFLYRRSHPRIVEVSQHHDGTLRDRRRFDLPPLARDLFAVRMDSALNFLTAANLERVITARCSEDRSIRRVLFCAGSVNDIDATGVDTLESLHMGLQSEGVELYVSAIKKQVWDVLDRAGMIERLGVGHIFATDREAIQKLKANPSEEIAW
jgi:sulfate permease, SulP family